MFQSLLWRFSTLLYKIVQQCNGSVKVTEPVRIPSFITVFYPRSQIWNASTVYYARRPISDFHIVWGSMLILGHGKQNRGERGWTERNSLCGCNFLLVRNFFYFFFVPAESPHFALHQLIFAWSYIKNRMSCRTFKFKKWARKKRGVRLDTHGIKLQINSIDLFYKSAVTGPFWRRKCRTIQWIDI